MIDSWKKGNNVVLAVREDRKDKISTTFFANMYYRLVRMIALPNMPKGGFDVYLVDRKVIRVLNEMDEKNSALTGQILWAGFKTDYIYYTRLERKVGKSRWTVKKKIGLVKNTVFSFSTLPITLISGIGVISFVISIIWAVIEVICKLLGLIQVSGWTMLFIFQLLSFGLIMLTMGILGEYLWRTFDATRNRPAYIVEEEGKRKDD